MTVQNSTANSQDAAHPDAGDSSYHAARHGTVVVARTDTARLRLTGADRVSWLQGLVTNDVARLSPGHGCYAAYLTPQGRMITDLRILAGPDELLLDVPAALAVPLRERLDRFVITEDVTIVDVGDTARLAVHGPTSLDVLVAALGHGVIETTNGASESAADLKSGLGALDEHGWSTLSIPLEGQEGQTTAVRVQVVGSRELRLLGFDVHIPRRWAQTLTERLIGHGASAADSDLWHVLRIEAGTPVFGIDMDEHTIPLEAGIEDRAISFSKGCYVGQEVIVRVSHRGQGRVARRLVGLRPAESAEHGAAPLGSGDIVTTAEGDRPVGQITSVVFSPTLGHRIALGYVQRELAQPGTVVRVHHESGVVALVVTALPFVEGERRGRI